MVSIIKVTSVQDTSGNNETTTANIKKSFDGAAKVWANFDQDPATLEDSINVSSLTDNGTSNHTITFSSSFANNRYAAAGTAQALSTSNGSAQTFPLFTVDGTAAPTASTSRIHMRAARSSYGAYDYNNVTACYHGDLA